MDDWYNRLTNFSVPIRGLFNLTKFKELPQEVQIEIIFSVPIRGLFNLTERRYAFVYRQCINTFRPHQGII